MAPDIPDHLDRVLGLGFRLYLVWVHWFFAVCLLDDALVWSPRIGPDGMERALVMTMDVVNSLGSWYDPGRKGVSRKQKREKKERVISGDSSSADD